MGRSKVIYGNETLIDLTEDTVTADKLAKGYTAHDKSGEVIVGTGTEQLTPIEYDYNIGYVDNGTWKYENPTNTYTDIYEVSSGQMLFISLGANVGSRFRAMFTTTDVRQSTRNVNGTNIINTNNPTAYRNATFNISSDGYVLIAKDNVGKTGINTYVLNIADWA